MNWFPVPTRPWIEPCWIARFECGHHATFTVRPMIENRFRYGCPHCGGQYITALCKVPESR